MCSIDLSMGNGQMSMQWHNRKIEILSNCRHFDGTQLQSVRNMISLSVEQCSFANRLTKSIVRSEFFFIFVFCWPFVARTLRNSQFGKLPSLFPSYNTLNCWCTFPTIRLYPNRHYNKYRWGKVAAELLLFIWPLFIRVIFPHISTIRLQ